MACIPILLVVHKFSAWTLLPSVLKKKIKKTLNKLFWKSDRVATKGKQNSPLPVIHQVSSVWTWNGHGSVCVHHWMLLLCHETTAPATLLIDYALPWCAMGKKYKTCWIEALVYALYKEFMRNTVHISTWYVILFPFYIQKWKLHAFNITLKLWWILNDYTTISNQNKNKYFYQYNKDMFIGIHLWTSFCIPSCSYFHSFNPNFFLF